MSRGKARRAPRVALLQLKQRETESMTMSLQTIDATATGNDGDNEMNAVTLVPNQDALLATPSRTAIASALLAHANRVNGGIPTGMRIKFVDGAWTIGGEPADPKDEYFADPFTVTTQWECWVGNQVVDRVVAPVGGRLPDRNTLGHDDENAWETGLDNRPRDPWSQVDYLPLVRVRDGEKFYYGASTKGGKDAIAELCRAGAIRPEEVAIITLEGSEYKSKRYNRIVKTPDLAARRWVRADCIENKNKQAEGQIAAPIGTTVPHSDEPFGGPDLDDDLPF